MGKEGKGEKVGEKFRRLREERGLRQEDVARALNVRQTAVSYWETGKRNIDLETLKKLCEFFELSFSEVIAEDDSAHYYELPQKDSGFAEFRISSFEVELIKAFRAANEDTKDNICAILRLKRVGQGGRAADMSAG